MKEEISLRPQAMPDLAPADPGRHQLQSMRTPVLHQAEPRLFTRPGPANVFERANRPGDSSIARWNTLSVFGREKLGGGVRIARWNTSHALKSAQPPERLPLHCQI
jgi:hypothetical protein